MSVFDELPPPPHSEKQSLKNPKTRYQFAVILNGFALVYHLLHKFIMPLVVIYTTSLPTQQIEKIDWWWLYHAVLAYFLIRKKWHTLSFRFVVAFGFGGLSVQILESLAGKSWHSFSLWLTALTTLAVLLYILSLLPKISFKQKIILGCLGFLCGLGVEGGLYYFYNRKPYDVETHPHTAKHKVVPLLTSSTTCGLPSFSLRWYQDQIVFPELKDTKEIAIQDCGLPLAVAKLSGTNFTFSNETSSYMNVKLSVWDDQGWRGTKNIPLPKNSQMIEELLGNEPAILVSSDARPQIGILLLIRDQKRFSQKIRETFTDSAEKSLIIFRSNGIESL